MSQTNVDARNASLRRSHLEFIGSVGKTFPPMWLLLLVQRCAVAAIFLLSGRTKVEGWATIADSAFKLFRSEYRPDFARNRDISRRWRRAPVPNPVGPGSVHARCRLALLGMTLIIQILVYPDAWPTHLSWRGYSCRSSRSAAARFFGG